MEPPNKLLKTIKEGRGKEVRWREDYEDSEVFDNTLENNIYQIDEYTIKELKGEEVNVDVSFSSLKADTTRVMVNSNVCSFKRETEWICFCNKFNNNKILLHDHSDTSNFCSVLNLNHYLIHKNDIIIEKDAINTDVAAYQDALTSYTVHNVLQGSFQSPMEGKCETVLAKNGTTIDFNTTHKWKTGISKLHTTSQNKRKHPLNFLSTNKRNENSSTSGLEIKENWSPFVVPLLKINGTPIGYWNNPKNALNLPLDSTTLTVPTPTVSSYFQFIDFWHPDLVKNLQQQL